MKLIGVGFGRSGTMSLKGALEQLGADPCFHMIDLIMGEDKERDLTHWERIANGEEVDWQEVFEPWEATVDWPACHYWRELADAFPDTPILLNHRDFDGFYKSCENTILAVKKAAQAGELTPDSSREPPSPKLFGIIEKLIWQGDFQGRFEDKEWVRQMYHDRIETIKREIPSDRLILWELGKDGWGPLADALGVPAPSEPFPHLHDTNEFRTEFGLDPVPA